MRLDLYIFEKFGLKSRTFADNLIKKGLVDVCGRTEYKPSFDVDSRLDVKIRDENEFASLGGDKLNKAFDFFGFSPKGLTAVDIGASNGGFCDCMLRRGAKKVYAVDVADCALPDYLKNDFRVVVRDKLNAKNLSFSDIGEKVGLITVDVSFISLKHILGRLGSLLDENGVVVALIKPQFELGRMAGKSGVVTDANDRMATVNGVLAYAESVGLGFEGICAAPRNFKNKNIEYLCMLKPSEKPLSKRFGKNEFANIL